MRIAKMLGLAILVCSSVSCGDLVRQGRSPVYLTIDALTTDNGGFLLSDVQSDSGSVFDDVGNVVLRTSLKDVLGTPTNPAAPTTNNDVTINRIHIAYRRADGRNNQGVDVPYAFDGAATATVSVGETIGVSFELVRHEAKLETPLVQLRSSLTVITTLADVTFYGRDQAGNELSVTGTIQVNFGDFAG